jgi:hypothetical protein
LAALFCWFAVILVLACAVLHFIARFRKLACWLLVLFPAVLCCGILLDLAHGMQKLGQAGYSTDIRTLPYFAGLLVVTLLAAIRPKSGWLFWIVWTFNLLFCALVVFLTYFWKMFS